MDPAGGPRGCPAAAPVSAAGTAYPPNPDSAATAQTADVRQAGGSPGTAARPTAAINPAGVHHPWQLIVSRAQPQVAPVFVTGGCAAAVLPGRNTGLGGPTS